MDSQDYNVVQSTFIILGVNCVVFPAALAFVVAYPGSTRSATSLLLTEFVMDQTLLIMGVRTHIRSQTVTSIWPRSQTVTSIWRVY